MLILRALLLTATATKRPEEIRVDLLIGNLLLAVRCDDVVLEHIYLAVSINE